MTLLIEIGHIKRDANLPNAIPVYVGRAMRGRPGSPLGNPYKLNNEADRLQVIKDYRKWLWAQMQDGNGSVMTELRRLHKMAKSGQSQCLLLLCWCRGIDQQSPACHADVIEAALQWMDREKGKGVEMLIKEI